MSAPPDPLAPPGAGDTAALAMGSAPGDAATPDPAAAATVNAKVPRSIPLSSGVMVVHWTL